MSHRIDVVELRPPVQALGGNPWFDADGGLEIRLPKPARTASTTPSRMP